MVRFSNGTILLEREPNELDKFVIGFVRVLEPVTHYVIVSGYVALLFGRSRQTEDVDLIVPHLDFATFKNLHDQLISAGYWCLNTENAETAYADYLEQGIAARYAVQDTAVPNVELKFAKTVLDRLSLAEALIVELGSSKLRVSQIELQIAYKRIVLRSEKDMEDARHLEVLFKDALSDEKLKKYEALVKQYAR